jgi:hypothetical protein
LVAEGYSAVGKFIKMIRRYIMALTQKQIQALMAKDKRQQFGCGDGLNIVIEPTHKGGGKSLEGRYKTRVNGTTKQIPVRIGVFGTRPGQHSLRKALAEWNEIKFWAKRENQDPRLFGKDQTATVSATLSDAINAFLISKSHLKEHTLNNYRLQLNNQVLSVIQSDTPLAELEWDKGGRQKVMDMKKRIEDRGSFDQANRVQKVLSQCFDHAIDQGWMNRGQNPAAKQSKEQLPNQEIHHPTIAWPEVGKLLEDIKGTSNNRDLLAIERH